MLDVSGMSVSYRAHRALEGASVHVGEGEIVVILGANGAGKSSLLKAIAGTCEGQVEGQVTLAGTPISGLPAEQIVVQGVAFVPEDRGIFGDLRVDENLMLGAHAREARAHQQDNLARVYRLFPKLRERASQIARTMSGGEQQMVAIGRAMMANPRILMLDEPSLGLSPLLCKELFQSLAHVRDIGIGVLMVEQNAKQSLAIADRAYLLENGSIVGEGSAESMVNDPAIKAAYLGAGQGGSASSLPPPTRSEDKNDADATLAEPRFIQPSPAGQSVGSSSQFAGVDIGSLVDRASQLADPGRNGQGGKVQTPRQRIVPALSSDGASSGPLSLDDADVQKLLADFEAAALAARKSGTAPNGAAGKDPAAFSDTSEGETLPEIPVYRKSKLEIYRRTPAGELLKVEEK